MAMTTIEAVRVFGADNAPIIYPWNPSTFYVVRDDRPWIDVLVRGHPLSPDKIANAVVPTDEESGSAKRPRLRQLDEAAPNGAAWHRWDFEAELARERRLGELTLPLKTPKAHVLQCYIVPAQFLDVADVLKMADDIESEVSVQVLWDLQSKRPGRAWSREAYSGFRFPKRILDAAESELHAALEVRRRPYEEATSAAGRSEVIPENAIVSHWASCRLRHLTHALDLVGATQRNVRRATALRKAVKRTERLSGDLAALDLFAGHLSNVAARVGALIRPDELATSISPGPAIQRDHRLRQMMKAFAPPVDEALSPIEAARSQFPPVMLNHLWELWGAVWLAKLFRSVGFVGDSFRSGADSVRACSWTLRKDDIKVQIDYEADPTLINYSTMPPVHERREPALEWAARHQAYDEDRPFFGMSEKASPDYLIRITTNTRRVLLVGDACLASPEHHLKGQASPKPVTVEQYRRTVAWVAGDTIVRCHPMGGFVVFPPPADAWSALESLPGAPDCTLLCPAPRANDELAKARFLQLLETVTTGA